eukprot:6481738-Amphidinium_carterae.3
MKEPREGDWCRLKRVGGYLLGHPCLVNAYHPQPAPQYVRVIVDSDHAGEPLWRRSTTGTFTMLGGHCLKGQANWQSAVVLSSGESEYYAANELLLDSTFASETLPDWYILKVSMLSGRSTVVFAGISRSGCGILALIYGIEVVPSRALVSDWPGLQPRGELSEYQLVAGTQQFCGLAALVGAEPLVCEGVWDAQLQSVPR